MAILKLILNSRVKMDTRTHWSLFDATVIENEFNALTPEGVAINIGSKLKLAGKNMGASSGQTVKIKGEFKEKNDKFLTSILVATEVMEVTGKKSWEDTFRLSGIENEAARKRIEALIDEHGEELIFSKDESIYEKIKDIEHLIDSISTTREAGFEDARKLLELGINNYQVTHLVYAIKTNVYETFIKNPYAWIFRGDFPFSAADTAGKALGFDVESPERIAGLIKVILDMLAASGDIYHKKKKVLEKFFTQNPNISKDAVKQAIKKMMDEKQIVTDGPDVALASLLNAEEKVSQRLAEIISRNQELFFPDDAPLTLNSNDFAVMIGGPGTGKTFTLKQGIKQGDVLVAPTGIAAKRMSQQSGEPAHTIHSFLRIKPGDKVGKVKEGVGRVVIDESSMLDIELAAILLDAIPKGTGVVFIGDTNQLPAVGAGDVLGSVQKLTNAKIELTDVKRQSADSLIHINAEAIKESDLKRMKLGSDFEFIEVNGEKNVAERALREYQLAAKEFGIANTTLLSPLRRKYSVSTNVLNPKLQAMNNPSMPSKMEITVGNKVFRQGDRVISTANTDVTVNGDNGTILDISEDGALTIDFGYPYPTILKGPELDNLDYGYAITVHKSQGSEYQCVIVPVCKGGMNSMLQRNLVYTAITRAKTKVIIVGEKDAFKQAILSQAPKRNTKLLDKTRDYLINLREKYRKSS